MRQIRHHRFPSGFELPIAGLKIGLEKIESLKGFDLDEWEEDGLGTARGGFFELASHRIVLVRELEHAREYLGAAGPDIHVDGADIIASDIKALVADVLEGLSLTADDLAWIENEDARQTAAQLIQYQKDRTR